MRNPAILLIVLLLPLFTACKGIGSLQVAQDRPEDIQQLLEHNEFARARQLTGKYPAIDTPELQVLIDTQEADYEDSALSGAHELESEDDLLGAVLLLSDALQKVPNSNMLREYRNRLEQERLEKIRANERRQLIARAEYLLNQRALFEEQHNLQTPNLAQRWEHTRNDSESETLAERLRTHGEHAFEQDDLPTALECLQRSMALHDSPAVRDLLNRMKATRESQQKVAQKQVNINKAKKQSRLKNRQAQKTLKFIAETRRALSNNDLATARAAFDQIPSPVNTSSETRALREELDSAIGARVAELIFMGDRAYRADDVDTAIRAWSEAQQLDPENRNLNERLDRAVRVLARLEQLKLQQGK